MAVVDGDVGGVREDDGGDGHEDEDGTAGQAGPEDVQSCREGSWAA